MRWGWIIFWIIVFIAIAPVAAANLAHAIGPALNHVANSISTFAQSAGK